MGRRPKKTFPTDQTICIDDCECVYCGHKFNGRNATNNDMDCGVVKCPLCERGMYVSLSVEYMCTQMEEEYQFD
jgi:hypothetical protein